MRAFVAPLIVAMVLAPAVSRADEPVITSYSIHYTKLYDDACTTDACEAGACVFTPVTCDDHDACTTDACEGGECVFTPVTCDDHDGGALEIMYPAIKPLPHACT